MNNIIISIIAVFAVFTELYAIQVLPPAPNPWGDAGRAMGQGFGDGFNQGMQQAMAERKKRKEEEKNIKIMKNLLKDYTPEKNSEYVLKILQSDLPQDLKQITIKTLNDFHQQYLREKRKDNWFFKLFSGDNIDEK